MPQHLINILETVSKTSLAGISISLCVASICLLAPWSILLAQDEPVPVSARPLSDVAVRITGSASATVISLNRTIVASQLAGVVERVHFEVGQKVARDEILARVDCADYEQSLNRDRANLVALTARRRLAREQLDRAQKLLPTRNISEEQVIQRQSEFDGVKAEIRAQDAQIEIAARKVENCNIRSPFSGIVIKRPTSRGAYVTPGTPIIEVIDTDTLEVSAQLSLEAGLKLPDNGLVFRADNTDYPLHLRTILPLVAENTRTREARLAFKGKTTMPGTPGRLHWTVSELAIPAYLLVVRDDIPGIFIADGNHARFEPFPAALQGRPAASDLPSDVLLVIDGRHGLNDGAAIQVNQP